MSDTSFDIGKIYPVGYGQSTNAYLFSSRRQRDAAPHRRGSDLGGRTLTSQDRIEEHLRKHAGSAFCAACVADEVGVSPTLGRAIVWMLLALPDYQMVEGECVSCLRVKR